MLKERTVLVLGAGASSPYGFPLGGQLRDSVLRSTEAGTQFRQQCISPEQAPELEAFAKDLSTSGFRSVDAFLEHRPHWLSAGKLAMAWTLLDHERATASKLFPPYQPGEHWYEALWNRLKGKSWSAFKKQPLTIVTFNYDRSLEHYLVRVACNNYSIRPQTALAGLPIIHVHGTVGAYNPSLYGVQPSQPSVLEAADSIRVVHEADVQHSEFTRARGAIQAAGPCAAPRIRLLGLQHA